MKMFGEDQMCITGPERANHSAILTSTAAEWNTAGFKTVTMHHFLLQAEAASADLESWKDLVFSTM